MPRFSQPSRTARVPAALVAALIAAGAVAACAGDERSPAEPDLVIPVYSYDASGDRYQSHTRMIGAHETPPRDTPARGELILTQRSDGSLTYTLVVRRIEDVTQAHIHQAPPGVAGPPIVWLYPSAPPAQTIQGRVNGVLAQGVISDANVVGPLAGQGVAGLLETIRAGNAYANVHTEEFPPGAIRGQVDSDPDSDAD